ncbi:transposase [Enterovibrio norvegicus]|uniref:transposase n=1 Tax=Enterovibrio norvegicus TaxID=188144 RepID=UPI001F524954|nr:transposase [Enterovibrio norvegicus]
MRQNNTTPSTFLPTLPIRQRTGEKHHEPSTTAALRCAFYQQHLNNLTLQGKRPVTIMPETWVVDCRAVGRGLSALKYLSRYLYRGVLPDKDIIDISDHQVTFRYTDSQTKQSATRSLPTHRFLMLILQHVLPKGLQRVSDYGLLHGSAKRKRHHIQLMLLQMAHLTLPLEPPAKQPVTRCCPTCGERLMVLVGVTRPR